MTTTTVQVATTCQLDDLSRAPLLSQWALDQLDPSDLCEWHQQLQTQLDCCRHGGYEKPGQTGRRCTEHWAELAAQGRRIGGGGF